MGAGKSVWNAGKNAIKGVSESGAAGGAGGWFSNMLGRAGNLLGKLNPTKLLQGPIAKGAGKIIKGIAKIPGLGAIITGIMGAIDIASIKNNTELSKEEKKEQIGKTIVKTVGEALGSVAGGALGTLIPIPGIGTLIGTIGGAWVGGKIAELLAEQIGPTKFYDMVAAIPGVGSLISVDGDASGTVEDQSGILNDTGFWDNYPNLEEWVHDGKDINEVNARAKKIADMSWRRRDSYEQSLDIERQVKDNASRAGDKRLEGVSPNMSGLAEDIQREKNEFIKETAAKKSGNFVGMNPDGSGGIETDSTGTIAKDPARQKEVDQISTLRESMKGGAAGGQGSFGVVAPARPMSEKRKQFREQVEKMKSGNFVGMNPDGSGGIETDSTGTIAKDPARQKEVDQISALRESMKGGAAGGQGIGAVRGKIVAPATANTTMGKMMNQYSTEQNALSDARSAAATPAGGNTNNNANIQTKISTTNNNFNDDLRIRNNEPTQKQMQAFSMVP